MELKEYLAKHQMTQTDFAKMLGVTQQAVAGYCAGDPPKRKIAYQIVKLTSGEVTILDLWGKELM